MNHKKLKDYFFEATNQMEVIDFELKEKYLFALKEIVPFEGWGVKALEEASIQLGFEKAYYKLLFPQHIAEVVEFYEDYLNAEMLQQLSQMEAIQSVTKRIETALNLRIINNKYSKLFIRKTSEFYMHPENIPQALRVSWKVANLIWYYAGDNSTDYNYYTKRSLLVSIYIAAQSYFLTDDSEDSQKTREFITKSLAKIADIAKLSQRIKSSIPSLSDIPIIRMFL
jgi:ubiquinone biosynthesis protein COQ9